MAPTPPRRRFISWKDCYEAWLAEGYHPASAKSEADKWQKNREAYAKRKERAKKP